MHVTILEKIIKSENNSDNVFDKFVTNTFKMRQFEVAIMEKFNQRRIIYMVALSRE